jgi:hypothetical protein
MYPSRSGGGVGRSDPFGPFGPCGGFQGPGRALAPEHTGRSDGGDGRFEPFRQCPVPPNRPGAGTEPVPSLYPSRSGGGGGRSDPFGHVRPVPCGGFQGPGRAFAPEHTGRSDGGDGLSEPFGWR